MPDDLLSRDALSQADLSDVTTGEPIGPVPPGEVLREEFMLPLRVTARALARDLGVSPDRISEIVNGGRALTARIAVLLGERFGTSAEFWMNLQVAHDWEVARRE